MKQGYRTKTDPRLADDEDRRRAEARQQSDFWAPGKGPLARALAKHGAFFEQWRKNEKG